MDRALSLGDEYDLLIARLHHQQRPSCPNGALTDDDLYEWSRALTFELFEARMRSGLTQEHVAQAMGTTRSAVCRMERVGPHPPSFTSLCRYAAAVGCTVRVRLAPRPEADLRSAGR